VVLVEVQYLYFVILFTLCGKSIEKSGKRTARVHEMHVNSWFREYIYGLIVSVSEGLNV
jgi:hypothetical protein